MKNSRAGNYSAAFNNFQSALYHAEKCNNKGLVSFGLEIIAQTYCKMGSYEDGAIFARKSLDQYKDIESPGEITAQAIDRVGRFVQFMDEEKNPLDPKFKIQDLKPNKFSSA